LTNTVEPMGAPAAARAGASRRARARRGFFMGAFLGVSPLYSPGGWTVP
jgi:hypothetical protein